MPLAARADAVELLDGGCLSLPEIEQNLVDLARLNRLPGGTAASVSAIERLVGADAQPSILDVGTGSADMPISFAARGWRATGIDLNPDVLLVARRAADDHFGVEIVAGDARSLPFADGAFDVAHCSLLVHHFEPDDAVAILREMRRVARRGVVVNDLRRGLLPIATTAASIVAFGRSRVTWTDGLPSVRRAYTLPELDGLLAAAGLGVRWRSPGWHPRVVTLATKETGR
jgi:SAM-dependent methyltransferase